MPLDQGFLNDFKLGKARKFGDVLIVDDEPNVCEVVEAYLRSMACFRHILKAHDGVQAIVKLMNQKFTMILLDLSMPKKEGLEIIRAIAERQEFNTVSRVIIMSGTMDEFQLKEAVNLGVSCFIVKPFDREKFVVKVQDYLKKLKPGDQG